MLKLGGYINILIAAGHIVGLIWANKIFEVTGIDKFDGANNVFLKLPWQSAFCF